MAITITATQKTEIESAFLSNKTTIDLLAKKFWNHYGGELEELKADAYTIFIDVYQKYNDKYDWHNWICNRTWYGLLDIRKKESKRKRLVTIQSLESPETLETSKPFDTTFFMNSLRKDAQLVAQLVLETPAEIREASLKKGGSNSNFRASIKNHLVKIGWTSERITESFDEVKKALG